jgi:fatty acid desaturase
MHLQHHKHTNDPANDPDLWVACGPTALLPLRWLSIEIKYYSKYLPMIFKRTRPVDEIVCVLIQLTFMIVSVVMAYKYGFGDTVLVSWIIPGRLSLAALAYCFDYLPHRPHKIQRSENPAAATCVTSLYGNITWLLTWPLLHQNYHVIHHFAPHIPFYHYSTVWKEMKEELIKKGVVVNPMIGSAASIMTATKVD